MSTINMLVIVISILVSGSAFGYVGGAVYAGFVTRRYTAERTNLARSGALTRLSSARRNRQVLLTRIERLNAEMQVCAPSVWGSLCDRREVLCREYRALEAAQRAQLEAALVACVQAGN